MSDSNKLDTPSCEVDQATTSQIESRNNDPDWRLERNKVRELRKDFSNFLNQYYLGLDKAKDKKAINWLLDKIWILTSEDLAVLCDVETRKGIIEEASSVIDSDYEENDINILNPFFPLGNPQNTLTTKEKLRKVELEAVYFPAVFAWYEKLIAELRENREARIEEARIKKEAEERENARLRAEAEEKARKDKEEADRIAAEIKAENEAIKAEKMRKIKIVEDALAPKTKELDELNSKVRALTANLFRYVANKIDHTKKEAEENEKREKQNRIEILTLEIADLNDVIRKIKNDEEVSEELLDRIKATWKVTTVIKVDEELVAQEGDNFPHDELSIKLSTVNPEDAKTWPILDIDRHVETIGKMELNEIIRTYFPLLSSNSRELLAKHDELKSLVEMIISEFNILVHSNNAQNKWIVELNDKADSMIMFHVALINAMTHTMKHIDVNTTDSAILTNQINELVVDIHSVVLGTDESVAEFSETIDAFIKAQKKNSNEIKKWISDLSSEFDSNFKGLREELWNNITKISENLKDIKTLWTENKTELLRWFENVWGNLVDLKKILVKFEEEKANVKEADKKDFEERYKVVKNTLEAITKSLNAFPTWLDKTVNDWLSTLQKALEELNQNNFSAFDTKITEFAWNISTLNSEVKSLRDDLANSTDKMAKSIEKNTDTLNEGVVNILEIVNIYSGRVEKTLNGFTAQQEHASKLKEVEIAKTAKLVEEVEAERVAINDWKRELEKQYELMKVQSEQISDLLTKNNKLSDTVRDLIERQKAEIEVFQKEREERLKNIEAQIETFNTFINLGNDILKSAKEANANIAKNLDAIVKLQENETKGREKTWELLVKAIDLKEILWALQNAQAILSDKQKEFNGLASELLKTSKEQESGFKNMWDALIGKVDKLATNYATDKAIFEKVFKEVETNNEHQKDLLAALEAAKLREEELTRKVTEQVKATDRLSEELVKDREQHSKELAEMRSAHEKELTESERKHKEILAQEKELSEKTLAAQIMQHEQTMAQQKELQERTLAQLNAQHTSALAQASELNEKYLSKIDELLGANKTLLADNKDLQEKLVAVLWNQLVAKEETWELLKIMGMVLWSNVLEELRRRAEKVVETPVARPARPARPATVKKAEVAKDTPKAWNPNAEATVVASTSAIDATIKSDNSDEDEIMDLPPEAKVADWIEDSDGEAITREEK